MSSPGIINHDFKGAYFKVINLEFAKPQWFDVAHAKLLSITKEFSVDIKTIRKLVDVHADNTTVSNFLNKDGIARGPIVLLWDLLRDIDNTDKIEYEAKKIIRKYQLAQRWLPSIQIAILSDYLVLPFYSPITVDIDGVRVNFFQSVSGKIIESYVLTSEKKVAIKLTLTERISPSKLADYIAKDESIKQALLLLPEPKNNRVKTDSPIMAWGYQVWFYKTFVNKGSDASYEKIFKYLDAHSDEAVPIATELASHYKRFMKYWHNIQP